MAVALRDSACERHGQGQGETWRTAESVFRLGISFDARFAIGLHSGTFCARAVKRELDRAYRTRILRPGMDSIIAFDEDFDARGATICDLMDLSAHVAMYERPSSCTYRSVLVAPTREARAFADVFAATWHGLSGCDGVDKRPDHRVVGSLHGAQALLGAVGLQSQIDALRLPAGIFRAI